MKIASFQTKGPEWTIRQDASRKLATIVSAPSSRDAFSPPRGGELGSG
jgi:hypothetical protein